jgi:DNA-binding response OmpR family regulator
MTYRPLLVVIDDEPDMADLIASIGEMAGYRTECCLRAADFWNAPHRHRTRPDCAGNLAQTVPLRHPALHPA